MPLTDQTRLHRSWARPRTLAVSLIGILAVMAALHGRQADTTDRLMQLRFEAAVNQSMRATQQRVQAHDALLGELTLQFNYLGPQTTGRFADILGVKELDTQHPSITQVGYLYKLPTGQLQERRFSPAGKPVASGSVLERLSIDEIGRPLGYARDFNTLGISALMSADAKHERAAVMMVKPVYDNTTVGISRHSRRHHHRGWIYALVDPQRLLDGIEQSSLGKLDISVYDGLSRQSEATLLFGRHHREASELEAAGLESVRPVGLASRAWTQIVRLGSSDSVPSQLPAERSKLPFLILALFAAVVLGYGVRAWRRLGIERDDRRAF